MLIRRFVAGDESAVSGMIARALRITNAKDYSPSEIEELVRYMNPDHISECASTRHFYVAEEGGVPVGCASIGLFRGKTDESGIFTVFVDPDFQDRGIGRNLLSAVEADELFLRARRIEIASSVTAVGFYLKLGYAPKNGSFVPDEEHVVRMEKHRAV